MRTRPYWPAGVDRYPVQRLFLSEAQVWQTDAVAGLTEDTVGIAFADDMRHTRLETNATS